MLSFNSYAQPAYSGGATQSFSVCENSSSNDLSALLQISDPSTGNTETYSVTSSPTNGSITVGTTATSNGATVSPTGWSYTPTAGYSGTDAFTIQVTDGTTTVSTTINVTVTALPTVAAITGNTTLSTAITTALSDATGGGTWTSGSTGVATVNSSGVVSGVSAGSSLISYAVTTSGCTTTVTTNVTVNTPGNGLNFDGVDDQVVASNAYDLSNKSFTVEFWAQRAVSGNPNLIFGQGTNGAADQALHIGFEPTNVMRFAFYLDDLDASSTYSDLNWHHWAFTFDDATLTKTIYRDGVAVASGTASGHFAGSGNTNIIIGGVSWSSQPFQGNIDEVRVWNTVRTQTQIQNNMNCDIAQDPNLKLYYHFDEGTAGGSNTSITTAVDYSGNQYCGTLNNFALTGGTSNYETGAVGSCNTITLATPGAFSGNTPICGVGGSITLGNANTGGTWSTASGNVTVNPASGLVTGVTTGTTATVNYSLNCSASSVTVTVSALPDISNFTSPSATSPCLGSASTVTVNSTTLGAATFTVTYNLSGANTVTGHTATLTMGASSGTFTIPSADLGSTGSTTVTITQITNASACNSAVSSSNTASFNVNPNPNVTGLTVSGNTVCATNLSNISIASSLTNGTYSFQFDLGAPNAATLTATGVSVSGGHGSFFSPNLNNAGSTSVTINTVADGTTGCTSNSGATNNITVNPNPVVTGLTVSGSTVCAGSASTVTIGGSLVDNTYVFNFTLGAPNAGTYNSSATTTGGAGTFATPSLTNSGTTSIAINTVTDATTLCVSTSTATNNITVNANPTVYAMTGGGSYCAGGSGVAVGLANSQVGVNYQLYRGASTVGSPVAGTGAAISYGSQTVAGTYTVVATNATTGCPSNMSGSAVVVVNSLPNIYAVTGGGPYCSGGTGSTISLAGSDLGVNYQLFRGAVTVGSPVAGTGSGISFAPTALASTAYHAVATNATTGCTNNMSGTASVSILTSPAIVSMTGGGSVCGGGPGVPVGLAGSAIGIQYQLYLGGSPVGSPVNGVGAGFNFGIFTTLGTYTATATNTVNACTSNMSGTAVINAAAGVTTYTVTGGGHYCSGGTGVNVGLNNTTSGISYQLFVGASAVGSPVTGTGSAISFGLQTVAGTYTVVGTNTSTGCYATMTGTAVVTIDPLPTGYAVTGGGSYCAGGSGVAIGVSLSQSGVNYQLYNGASTVGSPVAGTGSAISFGLLTAAGTYSVTATNTTTACSNGMLTTVTVSVNALPTVTAGGATTTCAGSPAALSSGGAVSYTWSPSTALSVTTGSAVTASPVSSLTYTVTGTGANGCTNTATVALTVNPLPAVSGGSNTAICTGTSAGLTASGASTYIWAPSSTLSATTGASVTANPTSNTTYTVTGTDVNGCVNSATVTVSVNPLPTISGGPNTGVCTGGSTGLTASGASTYTWAPSGTLSASTGSGVTATPASTTTYTITGTDVNGCVNTGTVTVSVNAIPTVSGGSNVAICASSSTILTGSGAATYSWSSGTGLSATTDTSVTASPASTTTYTVTGSLAGCNNTAAVTVTVNPLPTVSAGSTVTICNGASTPLTASGASTYIWAPASTLSATTGTSVTANPTSNTTYTVTGTDVNGCSNAATVLVSVNPLPTVTVSAGSVICASTPTALNAGGAATYTWTPAASLSASTGASVTATPTVTTTYTVTGTSAASCSNTATVTLTVNPLPNNYAYTGGGSFCSGTSGVPLGLAGSDPGVNYQLYRAGFGAVGSPVAGTGSAISFGSSFTNAGTYNVVATNTTTGCTFNITGTVTITSFTSPAIISMTGGGAYCVGGTGVAVGLAASATGVNYQLYLGGSPVGSPVAGIGSSLSFGLQTTAGTYTSVATNTTSGCTSNMSGTAVVSVYPALNTYSATGGGSYCAGGSGVAIGLSSSDAGVNYQLYRGGSPLVGTIVSGTGSAISFGLQTVAGSYTVVATSTSTGCTANMSGSATITINALPTAYTVSGGGSYCTGGTGVAVGLANSQSGVNYQLYRGASTVGSPVAGTGSAITFGLQTTAGTYTVVATNTTTSCTNNMTGSATITINALPPAYVVSGGGTYCSGPGIHIYLGGSNFGINYQLYNGASTVGSPVAGTGGGLDFGPQTTVGTYTVVATNATTGCTSNMTGSAIITGTALPTVYAVTGGGGFCSGGTGVHVGLANSDVGVNYQLYRSGVAIGGVLAGTAAALDFGLQTVAGTYTVVGINASSSCTSNMSGSATVTVNGLPFVFAVSGGGSFCVGGTGVAVGLASSTSGVNYQLFRGVTTVGSPVAGTGSAISFGLQTVTGTYTVVATDATTGCVNNMSGSATVSNYAALTVFSVTGGGAYCAGGTGVAVGLGGSSSGVNYQLFRGASTVGSAVAGTGSALNFGLQTTAGTYTVVATSTSTGCTANMASSAVVSINSLPTAYAVTGGGSYCAGGTGVAVGLANSTSGVNYQLYNGASTVGSPVAGTGSAISFGLQTSTGTYTVVATDATTACVNNMTGSASVSINALPTAYTVSGGGSYCSGPGVHIYLSGSAVGVNYQLYNGVSTVGSPVAGTGALIDFGPFSTLGTYTVVATNTTTTCVNNMAGSASVTGASLPTVYTVTGGGSYCAGGLGVHVGLSNSDIGTNYQLYNGASTVGGVVGGTGAALDFGVETAVGTYTVLGINPGSSCTSNMTGTAVVSTNALPTAYTVTGGGGYCPAGTGVHVGLSNSASGINYQLYLGASPVGSPLAGTGAALDFGLQTSTGTYTVVATDATTTCTNAMTGSVSVSINPVPTVYTVTGGGSYCAGGAGVAVGLSNSQSGVNYQLFRGVTPVGSAVAGTGSAISLGSQTVAGTYTVVATNATTACTSNMTGSATVSINPLPNDYAFTGGSSYCAGGAGVTIGLAGSDPGVNYQLYRTTVTLGTVTVGSAVAGTGSAISMGTQTLAGVYTVIATNTTTGCTFTLSGSTNLVVNPLPAVIAVTGGGSYCAGGAGVAVTMPASATGVNYQLYLGVTPVGSPVAGIGSGISFGLQTTAGTYTVAATNATTGCSANMSGSATVSVYAALTAYSMTGGGSYCSGGTGVAVGLSGSTSGVNYQLYRGGSPLVGTIVAGTGGAISFGLQTVAGTYTAVATNTSTGCTANMTGTSTITINALPNAYTVTGGGAYCAGGAGVPVGLGNSDLGVNYQLYRGASTAGSPVAGTGAAITFGPQTVTGTYTVVATNTTTLCTNAMTGSVVISSGTVPAAYAVTGGGSYCTGGTAPHVFLAASQSLTNYQLYVGGVPVGSPVSGTGSGLDFGPETTIGTYTAIATSTLSGGCTSNMTGSATITSFSPLTTFAVTGGGSLCPGGTGVAVGLAGSSSGVNYQLYRGASPVGSAMGGSGAALNFGLQTIAGTYTVTGTSTSLGCSANMTGSAVVSVNAAPTAYAVTGGGTVCGSTPIAVGLANSDPGVNYQLYNGASTVGSPVAGTGAAISFGTFTTGGTYTVVATNTTTACTNNMTGSAVLVFNSNPTVYNVTGGGAYCSGAGPHVYVSNSDAGVNYQLFNGVTPVGSPVAGTGSTLDMGPQSTLGTYTVVATNATTACTSNMSGSASVTGFALPTIYSVTGGGAYCSGGSGVAVGLSGSDYGVSYQLYNGASPAGSPVAGTSSAISFGLQTAAGTYTVIGTNTATCVNTMSGSASVTVNTPPTAYTVTAGGSYCAGGTGVTVGVGNSASGVNYQLYRGATPVGSAVAGTGSAISFGLQTTAGTYSVVATDATTSCTSNMTGTVSVSISALPTAYSVTGGGVFCAGGSGVAVGLSGSQAGVNYQLYNGVSPVGTPVAGTGGAISFGLQAAAGTYTVVATNSTSLCTNNMTGSATVTINPQPTDWAFTGGTAYCTGGSGVTIGLAGSDPGVNYQLYRTTTTLGTVTVGTPVAGTGSAINFGLQTLAGVYTVIATNTTTGCTRTLSGSTNLVVYPLPAIMTVGGGGSYCAGGSGVAVTLPGSAIGVTYQLYVGGVPTGSPVPGVGGGLSFGLQTTPGSYTVIATNGVTGCTANMSGSATVAIYPALTSYSMTGGGSYCTGGTGVTVGLSGSTSGVNYQLYLGGSPLVGTIHAGTGAALSFGLQTTAGSYTVVATNTSTTCTANMSGTATVSVLALPTTYTITGGGAYCVGGTGVTIGLSNSDIGVNYQLFRGGTAVGSAVAGTAAPISFGLQTTAGTYTVVATNTTTSCTSSMSGSATVSINSLPAAFTVSGGGSFCTGPGPNVLLSGSVYGVNYQLYVGVTPVGSPVAGTGGGLNFGPQSTLGTYTVVATNVSTGCTNNMTGSATVGSIALPTVYTMTGGGSYCTGSAGVHVGLSGSNTGISYQLYNGGSVVGSSVAGTGSALDFGVFTTTGTYTVVATTTGTSCTSNMTGSAVVAVNPLPAVLSVTGGGSYCSGGAGVAVGLVGSVVGINYQLMRGVTAVGSPLAGTGTALSYGLQTTAGTYTVIATNATTGCVNTMSGSATVSINALPTVFTVTGGGSYCTGGTGVTVGLSGSQSGVSYQLYNGATPVGSAAFGTGGAISFGTFSSAATYTAVATSTSTGCVSNMTGSATITVNTLPNVYTVTGGGSYCSGGTGVHVGLGNSDIGVNYQLYAGAAASGSPVAGTGAALDFGLFTAANTYTVRATNATTGCTANMAGSATVSINALPTIVSMTGGGGFCSGGTGVHVGLNASVIGINYQLYRGGAAVGSPVAGTAGSLDFGLQTTAGTYTAVATNATTGCTSNMTGSATVSVYALPTVYTVTGGGSYCAGGIGVNVGLSGSSSSVSYKLFDAGTPVSGGTMTGSGSAFNFGPQTGAGAYTVTGTDLVYGCVSNMSGSVSVTILSAPVAGTITGPTTVHDGATITLTDPSGTSGGTWNSSSTAIMTIGSTTGIVTGVSAGYANISYTVVNTCGTARTVATIHELGPVPMPEGAVTSGNTTICVDATTTLTNSVAGGIWSSGDKTIAVVDAKSGVVTGVSAGIVPITYTLMTAQGKAYVFTPVVVNAAPDAAVITAKPGLSIASGQKLTLNAAVKNSAAVQQYEWLLNNDVVTGVTGSSYSNNNFANNDMVTCRITGVCGTLPVSSTVVVKVSETQVAPVVAVTGDIRVVPNPNNGSFAVKGVTGSTANEEVTLMMTDVLGQVVYSAKVKATAGVLDEHVQLDNTVANGMYLLTVQTAEGNKVFHVIIEQ